LLLSTAGCISVSRQVHRDGVTSSAADAVTAGGRWEIEQEWECSPADRFYLGVERDSFDRASASRLERGWDLADFDLVTVPDSAGTPDQVCLVGTFRRWIEAE
jgi:hypothetical protein